MTNVNFAKKMIKENPIQVIELGIFKDFINTDDKMFVLLFNSLLASNDPNAGKLADKLFKKHIINDQEKLMQQFEKWWRKEALIYLDERVEALYPIIRKYNKALPKVYLKKMKTLWGSCSVDREVVTFNQYLIKAKPACIDYVVLHELIHFIYPNHSKQFYDFLSIHMPDWRERKTVLDQDVVHGL